MITIRQFFNLYPHHTVLKFQFRSLWTEEPSRLQSSSFATLKEMDMTKRLSMQWNLNI